MFRYILLIFITLSLLTSCSKKKVSGKVPSKIIVGTFSVNWLGDGVNDKIERDEQDYKRIATIIKENKLDVVALQQIENSAAMDRLMPYLKDYQYIIGNSSSKQNLVFLYKKDYNFQFLGELTLPSFENSKSRPGLIAKLNVQDQSFIFLNVHLKDNPNSFKEDNFSSIGYKSRILQNNRIISWCDSINKFSPESKIIVLGEFCDDFKNKTTSLSPFVDNNSFEVISKDLIYSTSREEKFHDHVILNKSASKNYEFGSARVYDFFPALDFDIAKKISFHCPIIFTINIKENLE